MKININNGVTAPKGFKAAGIHCGIKKSSLKKDLAIIYSDVTATACGVYTKNKVKEDKKDEEKANNNKRVPNFHSIDGNNCNNSNCFDC